MGIIIYGPQGCGKTRNADKLAKHFGLSKIVDNYDGKGSIDQDTLYLTNINLAGAMQFNDVISVI